MMELAKSGISDLADNRFEDSLRTVGQSKIVKNPQAPELKELIDVISADKKTTERAGFFVAIFLTSLFKASYNLTLFHKKTYNFTHVHCISLKFTQYHQDFRQSFHNFFTNFSNHQACCHHTTQHVKEFRTRHKKT